ncbi:MAG: sigma-70 family RNA polymerase sigma factor [Nannocystaceae bacterium]|nr:sigma-70 family RNA polymerase sigma factor [Nannocystaceae bacterium]
MAATAHLLATIERNRRRLWLLCYRMLGERSEADDVCQEAIARALERAGQQREADPTGWLLRVATRCCLDHLRRQTVRRRITQLVDPLPDAEPPVDTRPDERALLREDLRFAVVVALQRLSPRQRAALILTDVCDRPLAEVAAIVGGNANATKALLHRARAALQRARGEIAGDVPADPALVRAFAEALELGSIDALARLMAEDVWGVVDGGGIVRVASRPTRGRSVVARRFANARRRLGPGVGVRAEVRQLNGEPAIVVRLAPLPTSVIAVIHLVTRAGAVAAVLVDRDPRRLAALGQPLSAAVPS